MQIIPHLALNDCAQAMELYQEAFGAKMADRPIPGSDASGVRASMQADGMSFGLSDARSSQQEKADSIESGPVELAVMFHYSDDAQHAFDTLTQHGGQVRVALGETQGTPLYGQVKDRYGVTWHIVLE